MLCGEAASKAGTHASMMGCMFLDGLAVTGVNFSGGMTGNTQNERIGRN